MSTPTESRLEKMMRQQAEASRRYYAKKLSKQAIQAGQLSEDQLAKIAQRRTYYRERYQANKEEYKQRVKDYRASQRAQAQAQAQAQTN